MMVVVMMMIGEWSRHVTAVVGGSSRESLALLLHGWGHQRCAPNGVSPSPSARLVRCWGVPLLPWQWQAWQFLKQNHFLYTVSTNHWINRFIKSSITINSVITSTNSWRINSLNSPGSGGVFNEGIAAGGRCGCGVLALWADARESRRRGRAVRWWQGQEVDLRPVSVV